MTDRAKDIFLDALDLPEAERPAYVARASGDDTELLEQVRRLLAGHAGATAALGVGARTEDASGVVAGVAASALGELDIAPGEVLGNYRIAGVLGEGGHGRVYRAEQEQPVQRSVALKLIKPGMDTREVLARFAAERETLARMEHPNIARVLDAGATEQGRPYFVIELVDGDPITDYCAHRRLDARARIGLVRQVCLAIQHAHSKGVLHRDIKPTNVLVTEIDGAPQPRVIDFGIAKAIGDAEAEQHTQLTAEGLFIGTPTYMSPEQAAASRDVDTRSDVYALGVLLYELFTGRVPFEASGSGVSALLALQRQILEEEPVAPSAALRSEATGDERPPGERVPVEVDWIVLRCLEKDRDRRYPTAWALARDLERYLAGQPVEAAPPSRTYRARKLLRRHRTAALATATALLALVGGVFGTSVGMVRAGRANERLDAALERAEAEAGEAQRQARIADAVNDFLIEDLLSAAKPTVGPDAGPEVRMIDVLDAAAERMEGAGGPGGRFHEAPQVEARVRAAIANSYSFLGQYPAATEHFDRAYDLLLETLGPEHFDTLNAGIGVAQVLIGIGRHAEGEARMEALLPGILGTFGERSEEAAEAYKYIGLARAGQGRLDEAVEAYHAGLDAARNGAVEYARTALKLASALAIAEIGRGEVEEAERLFREVSEGHLELLGPEDPQTITVRANLATFLRSRGELDEAREILEETIEIQQRVLGAEHPTSLITLQSLGGLLRETGDWEAAEEVLTRVREGIEAVLGPSHPNAIAAMHSMAVLREESGDVASAEELLREAHARAAASLGERDNESLVRLENLGQFLVRQERLDEAEELLLGLRELLADEFGDDHARTSGVAATLAELAARPER